MKKKILAILLAAVLSVSMLSAAVSADGGEFTFDAETGTITGYTDDTVTELVIPAEIDGVAVKAIGNGAFEYFSRLTSVTIPDSVTTIGDFAFGDCPGLFRITIPDSVTTIGCGAFAGCENLTAINVAENNNSYTSLDGTLYTKDMKTIVCYPGAKSGNFEIPDGVEIIESFAFYYCENLTNVIISDSVKSIGNNAFLYCYNLPNISISDSVTTIGDFAFEWCSGLTSVVIPAKVTKVGEGAFFGCKNLTAINVAENNNSYTSLDGTLYTKDMKTIVCCPGAKSGNFEIPDGVERINAYTFMYCTQLTNVTIPGSVIIIDRDAFGWCDGLASVSIPKSITEINKNAFRSCTILADVYYSGTEEEWNAINIGDGNECLTNATIHFTDPDPDYSKFIFDAETGTITGYTDDTVTELVIPAEIDGVAVTTIGNFAFEDHVSLMSITIPDSVTTIGNFAFEDCVGLMSITIPDSVTTIGLGAFFGCKNLTTIYVAENNNSYTTLDGTLYTKDMKTIVCCPGAKGGNFEIPDGVERIEEYAFMYCTQLTSVTIPDSMTTIGAVAFYGCSSLTSVNIPSSVTMIGEWAFYECERLKNVTIPDGVTTIESHAFAWCRSLTSVTIPDGVTTIGDSAFDACESLTSVTIPDSVTTIDDYAFGRCRSLTSITIPDGVTTIGDNAFDDCASLTSVTIPKSVTTIGKEAFWICYSLIDVYYSGTEEEWNAIEIGEGNDCLTNATIHFAEPEPDPDPDPNPNPDPQPQPQPEPEPNPDPEPTPVMTYDDVPETHWAAEAISYVTEAGLFKGTSATDFSPNGYMTRAMLMVVLARLDGVDTEGGDGKWYEKGMEWAVNQGITDGSSPNENITRQQLVTMLWRYAGKPASNASLEGYSDAGEVASWATEAMKWAVENGIIKGTKKDVLSPNGYATRAQVATIIMRFVEM